MKEVWKFHTAGSIQFGVGAIKRLPLILKPYKKIAVITDPGIVQAGLLDRVLHILHNEGLQPLIYDEAMPEPSMSSVLYCFSQVEADQPEAIIALGGGSCIDLAKFTSLLLTYGGHPLDYAGENQVPGNIRPVIAIPTTAGTGSEVSPVAIVTDENTNLKVGISDNHLRPAVALLDPELTLKLPPYITACTGMDALAQAIEAYYAADYRFIDTEEDLIYQGSNPLSDHLAEKAIRLISQNLRMAVHQGHNLEARSNMLLGSLFSALSFTNSGTSLLHALAYPVAEKTKKAHGEIIGLLLPYVMQYNAAACMDKMAKIAEWLGENDPRLSLADKVKRSTDAVFRLLHDLRMPVKLADIGIKKEHIPEIVDKSLTIDRLIRINPRIPRADEVKSLLYRAL